MRVRSAVVHISAVVMVLAIASSGCAQKAQSFTVSGGFEEGDGDAPSGWSRAFYPAREGIEDCLERSDERARSGQWSLKVDTQPVVGEEVTLVFNGPVSKEATGLRGETLVLSGWVYIEPGTAMRPIGMRLRTFGPDEEGKHAFLGDVLRVKVLGKPGVWTQFAASGTVADREISGMDLHCAIRPDAVPTIQFLDDIRLELAVPAPLEMRPVRDAVWRDETAVPVEIVLGQEQPEAKALTFSLLDAGGKQVAQWERAPATGIVGLPLPQEPLGEGSYLLRAELRAGDGEVLASAEGPLEIAASPWEGAPAAQPGEASATYGGEPPEGFQVMGSVAPTDVPDLVPEQQEATSADVTSPVWQQRGYAVFSRHYLDPVSRLGRPRPGEVGPVRLFACRGEYEPAKLSVWAMQPLTGVSVSASDLRGENGAISASNIDVRVVRMMAGLPRFLERREAVDIPEGQTQTFWLTVRVPPDAEAGFYHAQITVAPAEGEPTAVELLVRILPLDLPLAQKGYGFWWKMDGRWNGYYSSEREQALEQIRKQFILLREHGCNTVSCYGKPKMTKAEDGTVTFDFEQEHWGHDRFSLADFFRLGRETEFLSPEQPIQYTGADSLHSHWIARAVELEPDSAAFDDFYREACRRVDEWVKHQGFTLAFACIDEIGNSAERRRDALRFHRIAQEAGALTSVTDNSMHGGMHLMGQARFDDIIAMRVYNFITPEMIEHCRQSGDALWLYNMASMGWNPIRDRFVFGLFTDRCGADGFCQWAFQWPKGNEGPYARAAAGQAAGYHYALPAPDGPLPALGLVGVREGIDDARYLALLRQVAPQSPAASLDDIEPARTAIESYLGEHSGNFFDLRRWRMAQEAMRASAQG